MNLCIICGHRKQRHFDEIDEDAGGHLRPDRGCWECNNCRGYKDDNQK